MQDKIANVQIAVGEGSKTFSFKGRGSQKLNHFFLSVWGKFRKETEKETSLNWVFKKSRNYKIVSTLGFSLCKNILYTWKGNHKITLFFWGNKIISKFFSLFHFDLCSCCHMQYITYFSRNSKLFVKFWVYNYCIFTMCWVPFTSLFFSFFKFPMAILKGKCWTG